MSAVVTNHHCLDDFISSGALKIQNGFPCGNWNDKGVGVLHLRPFNVTDGGQIDLSSAKFIVILSNCCSADSISVLVQKRIKHISVGNLIRGCIQQDNADLPTYLFSNSPVRCLLTNVVFPTPPSPTKIILNSGIACACVAVENRYLKEIERFLTGIYNKRCILFHLRTISDVD